MKPATSSAVPPPPPSTIVDFLSSDVQYSYFLRHLQRHGLIPRINTLSNVTLLAPVNSAFVDGDLAANDTPENLLRYFSDQRFRIGYMDRRDFVFDSLFVTKTSKSENRTYPLKLLSSTKNGEPNEYYVNDFAQVVEFDGYVKHQHTFIHAIDRLLPLSPTICDVLMDSSTYELNGKSISFMKQLFQLVFTKIHFKEENRLCEAFLANVSTIFIPTDDFVEKSMIPLQKRYYTALFHAINNDSLRPTKDAVREIKSDALDLLLNLVLSELVAGANGTSGHKFCKTPSHNNKYNITLVNDTHIQINGKVTSSGELSSLPALDGLMYVFDVDNLVDSFFNVLNIPLVEMIPRKTLFAMHYSNFVKELKFRKLGFLVDGSTTNQTIVLDSTDRDDIPDEEIRSEENRIEEDEEPRNFGVNSFSNKQSMLYRFLKGAVHIPSELTPDSPTYDRILTSRLCLKKRLGSCYKVKVSGSLNNGNYAVTFNDEVAMQPEPFEASGNNMIYVMDEDFLTPLSFKHTIADLISNGVSKKHLSHINIDKKECLQTLGYLNEYKLSLLTDNLRGYTVFLPCGNTIWEDRDEKRQQDYRSWNGLGLILKYLESNPKVMHDVLRGLFVEDLIYSDFGLENAEELSRSTRTLRGDPLNVSESYRSGDYNHIIRLNETSISVPLNSDILFNQGVIHITSKVLLPDDFRVSLKDLIRATQQEGQDEYSFLKLLEPYPKLADALGLNGSDQSSNYSIFVPSPEQLRSFNISSSYSRLWEFLELHLVPNSQVNTLLNCIHQGDSPYNHINNGSYVVQTNRTNGVFQCNKNPVTGKVYLQLQNSASTFGYNADRQVRIVSHGCSQVGLRSGSCVFLLEKPFSLGWFDQPDNFLHVHIGWISVGIGIIIGVILFGFMTTALVVCLSATSSKKKHSLLSPESVFTPSEPSYMRVTSDDDLNTGYYDYGYETDDDAMQNERERLLPGAKRKRQTSRYGASSLPIGAPNAPRYIHNNSIKGTLNRDRNLPPLNI